MILARPQVDMTQGVLRPMEIRHDCYAEISPKWTKEWFSYTKSR